MSVQIATHGNEAASSPTRHRVQQDAAARATQPAGSPAAADPQTSTGGAVIVDVNAAISNENAASAASDVNQLAAAAALVSQLVSQMAGEPAAASSAQGSPSPQAVLSLLA